jgi:DNA repair and recombination RAD54-like protein
VPLADLLLSLIGPACCSKKYEAPILAAREPWATDRQKEQASAASGELSAIVNQFILRRTNTLLSKHLPPKLLQVVCVRMSPLQEQLYRHFLEGKRVAGILSGRQSGVLASITALRKLVNHPKLVYDAMRAQQTGAGGRAADGAAGFEDCDKVRAHAAAVAAASAGLGSLSR